MDVDPPPLIAYTDAQIRAIVANLNESVTGVETLRGWVARSCLDPGALEETPERAYLHLAGADRHGRPVVLVFELEQHRWSRANGARQIRFGRTAQRTPHA